jgi:cobalt-zinc-cadmium efflux system outer membrane protein
VLGVTQSFLDLLMIPARKKVARAQLEATKLRVGDAVLALAADVRSAFFMVQGAQQVVMMRRLVAESAQASADLVARQNEAGNVSDLVLATENGVFEQAKLDLSRSELDVAAARERLTRLMGLWGPNTSWRAPSQLPNLPADEIPLERLESLAIAQRLDLGAARQSLQAVAYARSFASWSRWTGVIDVGAEVARLKSGAIVVGPSVALELPLFDQRQAVIARLEAQERAAALMVQALSIDIRSEVRSASYRVAWTRQVAEHYRKTLIPMKERIVALSQQEYDAMLLGVYQLILAKQNEASAYREYIETVRDYWIARSDLERAVGGKLTPKPASGAAAAIPASAPPVSTGGAAPPPPAHHHPQP